MTIKDQILKMLRNPRSKKTCAQITKKIVTDNNLTGSVAHYKSGSVSSILNKLVKDGALKYAEETGPKGGHVYQRNGGKK